MLKLQFSIKNLSDGNMVINTVHEMARPPISAPDQLIVKPGEEQTFFEHSGLRFVIALEADIDHEAKRLHDERVRYLGERAVAAEKRRHRKRLEKSNA